MRNSFLMPLIASMYAGGRTIRRKLQPKPATQSPDEALKLINKAEAKRQRKNKARLAREAANK